MSKYCPKCKRTMEYGVICQFCRTRLTERNHDSDIGDSLLALGAAVVVDDLLDSVTDSHSSSHSSSDDFSGGGGDFGGGGSSGDY